MPSTASFLNSTLACSENALVIDLERAELREIVEKKLSLYLHQGNVSQGNVSQGNVSQGLFKKGLFKKFFQPAEQAVIEFSLWKYKGNYFKSAKKLGINRNTLKKRLIMFKIDFKEILSGKDFFPLPSKIFVSTLSSLDLVSACRSKLLLSSQAGKLPEENILKALCLPVEKTILYMVLDYCKGNQIKAARLLGWNRNTLGAKLFRFRSPSIKRSRLR